MVIVFEVLRCLFSQWRYLCRIIVETGLMFHLVYVACSVRLVCSVTVLEFCYYGFLWELSFIISGCTYFVHDFCPYFVHDYCVSVIISLLFLEFKLFALSVRMCCCGVYCRFVSLL